MLAEYVEWSQTLPAPRDFAAFPLGFDGGWIDAYLRRFTRYGVVRGPYETDRLFYGAGLCLRSYAAALLGRRAGEMTAASLPAGWLGDIPHTHRAIDDARGYAHLLTVLLARARRAE